MKYFYLVLFAFVISKNLSAQTYERNAKESTEEFLKRNFSENDFINYKIVESTFNTPGKKIVFFLKKLAMAPRINDSINIKCMFANILIPENETSKKYLLQTIRIDCNRDFDITIDDATTEKDKQKNSYVRILYVQLTRKSTALLIKSYKTFHLKETSENNFTIEEEKE
ncbi:MAG: hypothetical protein ABIT08_09065 [Bacteroidia bacterium]